jgi:hypothetical protein
MSMPDNLHLAYRLQKRQAGYRGIAWELEYWEWLQIWQDSGHLHERGTRKGEWCMSRPGDKGPYAAHNVRIVHCETNDEENARAQVALRGAHKAAHDGLGKPLDASD